MCQMVSLCVIILRSNQTVFQHGCHVKLEWPNRSLKRYLQMLACQLSLIHLTLKESQMTAVVLLEQLGSFFSAPVRRGLTNERFLTSVIDQVLKNNFLFFLLWAVLNIRQIFPHVIKKYLCIYDCKCKKQEIEIRHWQFTHFHLFVDG